MRLYQKISALQLSLFIFTLAVPTVSIGASACSLEALDTVAGLGAQVSLRGCVGVTSVTLESPIGSIFTHNVTVDATGNGLMAIPSKQTTIAGTYDVRAIGATTSFDVIADRPDDMSSRLVAAHATLAKGGTTTVWATVYDKHDNPVVGRPMALLSSTATDEVTALSQETDEEGRMAWQVRMGVAGKRTLSLFDAISTRQMNVSTTVTAGAEATLRAELGMGQSDSFLEADLSNGIVDHYELSLSDDADTVQANALFSLRITAVDNEGNRVRNAAATSLGIRTTDPNAEFPKRGEDPRNPNLGRIDMKDFHQGSVEAALAFLFRSLGEQTISVYDKMNPDITGKITLTVEGKAGEESSGFSVMSPRDGSTIGSREITLILKGDTYVDYEVSGEIEGTSVTLAANEEGVAEGTVRVKENINEATLFIRTKVSGKQKMVHYKIDTTKPIIESIKIEPGKTKDPAPVTVKSEAGLVSAVIVIDEKETALTVSETDPTIYTGTVVAPDEPGSVRITARVRDEAGNIGELAWQWEVASKEIEKVMGLEAIAQAKQVMLKWKAVKLDTIREYKVYIAKKSAPTIFLYSIGTGKAVTSAAIQDLPPDEYAFYVTAVDTSGTESKEKSDPAFASPLSMRLVTTAGDQSLLIEWKPIANLPLSHYVLEYGVEDGVFTERKTINGGAESFMLRDLLPNIEYFIRLTPIALTGQTRADLVAKASGIPKGRGFAIGSSEAVPPDTFKDLHSGAPRQPVTTPRVPSTGVPTTVFVLIVVCALAAFGWYARQVQTERSRTQAFLESMQNRYNM